jgi:hydroxypyruvate reductase
VSAALRRELRAAFAAALAAVDLEERVVRVLPGMVRDEPGRRVSVVAIGKAAPVMMRGALSVLGDRVDHALLVAPEGVAVDVDRRVEIRRTAHPYPDRRSVSAARRALAAARRSDLLVALVSGGASSLVCAPSTVPLGRYNRIVSALLLGGATVREVNVVRRHLCAVKGGGLARAARGPIRTLIASDVIGGAAYDVGSGPTVADPTTRAQARAVLRRIAPELAPVALRESLKPSVAGGRRLRWRFVARPEDLARAVGAALRARGFAVRILPASLERAEVLAGEYLRRARSLRPGEALVRAAEPALRVESARPGRGGRSTHMAALVAAALPGDVAFLAGASDGVDGSSGTAGAAVDASVAASPRARAALASAIERYDTGSLLRAAKVALPCGPTGHNLADIHVLAREEKLLGDGKTART